MMCSIVERGVRLCVRKSPAYNKVIEVGERSAPHTAAEIYLQPMIKTMVTQVVSLQPMEDHAGADTQTANHEELHATADGDVLKEADAHLHWR